MIEYFKEIWHSFIPKKWHVLAEKKGSLGFVVKTLFLSFILMCIVFLPFVATIPQQVMKELDKFTVLNVHGDLEMTSPVQFPKENPVFVIDTTGEVTEPGKKVILVTKDLIYFRPLVKTYSISFKEFEDVPANKAEVKKLAVFLIALILPSILAYAFLIYLVKYLLIVLLVGTVYFLLLDLTHWKKPWKTMVRITAYSSVIPIALEVVSAAVSTKYLIPTNTIAGVITLYLVTTILFLALPLYGVICCHYIKK